MLHGSSTPASYEQLNCSVHRLTLLLESCRNRPRILKRNRSRTRLLLALPRQILRQLSDHTGLLTTPLSLNLIEIIRCEASTKSLPGKKNTIFCVTRTGEAVLVSVRSRLDNVHIVNCFVADGDDRT